MNSEIESSGIAEQEILKVDEKESTKEETNVTNKNQYLQNEIIEVNKQETIKEEIQQELMKQNETLMNLENWFQRMVKKNNSIKSEYQYLNEQLIEAQQQIGQQETIIYEIQFEKQQVQNDFENFKQQHALFVEQTKLASQTAQKQYKEEVKSLNNQINQLKLDIQNLEQQQSEVNCEIKEREAKTEAAQKEFQKLQQTLDQVKSDCNSLSQQKKNLEQTTKQLQNELDEAKKLYEAEKAKYRTAENDKTQLKGDLLQKDIELSNEKTNHEATKREKYQYQDQCKKMADQFKELQQKTTVEALRLIKQVQVEEKKIQRVLQRFGETKLLEKITGPLEKIMASEYKINRFTDDPNSISDNSQYNLIEITLQFDKYTKFIMEGEFYLIDECFQYGNKINITATRSIKANAESEFYQGYLIKIIESAQADLKNKTLLRKDLKQQNQAFQNKEEVSRLAVNNIFCQWLQMQFNKNLTIARLQPQKQTIQRQFIIENEAKKEYYYCEMVEEGPYSKINGGKFVPQKDDIHQYFNALSLYSYKMFEQQLILTNFQVCGNYVYDMIVHTNHKGFFSPLDQGPHESTTFTEILGKQPADIMSKSWNETVKSQAEKYLK